MYNLQKKIKEQRQATGQGKPSHENKTGRISVRDKLLTQGLCLELLCKCLLMFTQVTSVCDIYFLYLIEIQDISKDLPEGCRLSFPDADKIHQILLKVQPLAGFWKDGTFLFDIVVPFEYNIMVCFTSFYPLKNQSLYLSISHNGFSLHRLRVRQ